MYKRTGNSVKPTNKNVDTIPSSGKRKQLSVAGYCRVSTKDESQETSIENQRIHYQHYIESNPDWKLAGIYWETGVSGTSAEARPELQRLLADCRAGRVDMVVTKSISRFSRNTTDCLALVRELSALGVTLFFEKENLRTDEMGSEFFLSILAALSQEESRSISGNMKWAIRKRFRDGTYKGGKAPYGYRKTADSRYMIEPEEAAVVRRIFSALCGGMSSAAVAKRLNDSGIPTWSATHGQGDAAWSGNRIRQIAKNRFYVGDAIYQKTYTDDCYHQHPNHGELDIYLSENAHPAIVDRDTFAEVNAAIERNAEKYGRAKAGNRRANRYCSSGKFFCGVCGGKMYRSGGHQRDYICQAHARGGQCPMPQVPEKDILNAFVTLLNKLVFALRRGLPFPATEEADRNELQRIDDALSENKRRWDALYASYQVIENKQTGANYTVIRSLEDGKTFNLKYDTSLDFIGCEVTAYVRFIEKEDTVNHTTYYEAYLIDNESTKYIPGQAFATYDDMYRVLKAANKENLDTYFTAVPVWYNYDYTDVHAFGPVNDYDNYAFYFQVGDMKGQKSSNDLAWLFIGGTWILDHEGKILVVLKDSYKIGRVTLVDNGHDEVEVKVWDIGSHYYDPATKNTYTLEDYYFVGKDASGKVITNANGEEVHTLAFFGMPTFIAGAYDADNNLLV